MTITRTKDGYRIAGDSIDLMMGMAPRSTPCARCGHPRGTHHRSLTDPTKTGTRDNETFGQCEKRDLRRRTTSNGVCPCKEFVEPNTADKQSEDDREAGDQHNELTESDPHHLPDGFEADHA